MTEPFDTSGLPVPEPIVVRDHTHEHSHVIDFDPVLNRLEHLESRMLSELQTLREQPPVAEAEKLVEDIEETAEEIVSTPLEEVESKEEGEQEEQKRRRRRHRR